MTQRLHGPYKRQPSGKVDPDTTDPNKLEMDATRAWHRTTKCGMQFLQVLVVVGRLEKKDALPAKASSDGAVTSAAEASRVAGAVARMFARSSLKAPLLLD